MTCASPLPYTFQTSAARAATADPVVTVAVTVVSPSTMSDIDVLTVRPAGTPAVVLTQHSRVRPAKEGSPSGSDETGLVGEDDGLDAVPQAELGEDVPHVRFHR